MASREELLSELLAPAHSEAVLGLLLANRERLEISVPVSLLSKGASGAGSRVAVSVSRRSGASSLALDAGRFWRGAPSALHLDYQQLLTHANDDALQALHRKLMNITKSRSRGLTRTRSVPGRILFDDGPADTAGGSSSGGGKPAGGRLQRTSSIGLPPSALHRHSSSGLPPSGASSLRRTSSMGPPDGGSSSQRSSHSRPPAHGPSSLHRLSGTGLHRQSASSVVSQCSTFSASTSPAESEDETITACKLQQAAAEAAEAAALAGAEGCTPPAVKGLAPTVSLCFEDSAGPRVAPSSAQLSLHGSPEAAGLTTPPSTTHSSPGDLSSVGSACPGSPFAGAVTPLSGSPGAPPSCPPSGGSGASAGGGLARQPTFSQPYFVEFEDELDAQAAAGAKAAAGAGSPAAGSAASAGTVTPRTSPQAAAAGPSGGSGSVRAAQLVAAADQMTAEELHEVAASFNHVFVPPWAVPAAPREQVVRTFREAGVQTSTGAAGEAVPVRSTHTAEDTSDHFQAFMQHFSASLPHLAMALADMHLGRGGQDPTFIKSQYYFNSLLVLKDEMQQLGERLAPAGSGSSS